MAVPAGSIIKHLDAVEDVSASELAGFVDAFSNTFLFQTAEEGFGYRVDAPMSN